MYSQKNIVLLAESQKMYDSLKAHLLPFLCFNFSQPQISLKTCYSSRNLLYMKMFILTTQRKNMFSKMLHKIKFSRMKYVCQNVNRFYLVAKYSAAP